MLNQQNKRITVLIIFKYIINKNRNACSYFKNIVRKLVLTKIKFSESFCLIPHKLHKIMTVNYFR